MLARRCHFRLWGWTVKSAWMLRKPPVVDWWSPPPSRDGSAISPSTPMSRPTNSTNRGELSCSRISWRVGPQVVGSVLENFRSLVCR